MINSLEAKIGDCCYFLIRNEKAIKFGEIVNLYPRESAVQVIETRNAKYVCVWEKNAAWDEKELKGQKWELPHNYIREDIPKEISNEEEPSKRVSDVCDGKKKTTKRKRTKRKSPSVSKRASRKS
tara:strand:- start:1681 stop:2055 length:375 start_codon:yes stop_codon:yes gene_type:complete